MYSNVNIFLQDSTINNNAPTPDTTQQIKNNADTITNTQQINVAKDSTQPKEQIKKTLVIKNITPIDTSIILPPIDSTELFYNTYKNILPLDTIYPPVIYDNTLNTYTPQTLQNSSPTQLFEGIPYKSNVNISSNISIFIFDIILFVFILLVRKISAYYTSVLDNLLIYAIQTLKIHRDIPSKTIRIENVLYNIFFVFIHGLSLYFFTIHNTYLMRNYVQISTQAFSFSLYFEACVIVGICYALLHIAYNLFSVLFRHNVFFANIKSFSLGFNKTHLWIINILHLLILLFYYNSNQWFFYNLFAIVLSLLLFIKNIIIISNILKIQHRYKILLLFLIMIELLPLLTIIWLWLY